MKLVLLFTLYSTYLMGTQIPGDIPNLKHSKIGIEQNKIDSSVIQDLRFLDTTVIKEQSEDLPISLQAKSISETKKNKVNPAVGTLDKAFIFANDYCTTTLTKWDLFLQNVLTKIKNKFNQPDTLKSK